MIHLSSVNSTSSLRLMASPLPLIQTQSRFMAQGIRLKGVQSQAITRFRPHSSILMCLTAPPWPNSPPSTKITDHSKWALSAPAISDLSKTKPEVTTLSIAAQETLCQMIHRVRTRPWTQTSREVKPMPILNCLTILRIRWLSRRTSISSTEHRENKTSDLVAVNPRVLTISKIICKSSINEIRPPPFIN